MDAELMVNQLRSLAEAYPESVFPPLTDDQLMTLRPFMDRISAEMGRHFGPLINLGTAVSYQIPNTGITIPIVPGIMPTTNFRGVERMAARAEYLPGVRS